MPSRRASVHKMLKNALQSVFLFAVAGLLLAGCTKDEVQNQQALVMGTLASITVYAPADAQTDAAFKAAFKELEYLNHVWHPWTAGAVLADFNQALHTGRWVKVPPELQGLLRQALRYHTLSEGDFDPGLGQLTALWGFKNAPDPGSTHRPPAPSQVMALLSQGVGVRHLQLREDKVQGLMARADTPTLTLDFGGIAKGFAADQVVALLARYGIKNAIVNLGGNLRVVGSKGDDPWRIGVRAPRGGGVLAAVKSRTDMSVLTSGDYERYYMYEGVRYHHIMDPRTGMPARGLISVTVITGNATLGDAASTALFVAGPHDWPRVARELGVDKVLVVDAQDRVSMTPAMRPLVELAPGVTAGIRPLPAYANGA